MTQVLEKEQVEVAMMLDPNADFDFSSNTDSGTVYIYFKRFENNELVEKSVEIYFETNSKYDVTLLSVGDVFEDPNGAQNLSTYELNDNDKIIIKAIIKEWIESQIEDEDDDDLYDSDDDHGMTNSDFLYGYYA